VPRPLTLTLSHGERGQSQKEPRVYMTASSLTDLSPRAARIVTVFCIGLVTIVTIAMIAWIWPRCPGAVDDFGREVYVPWQLAQGKVLYRDISYINGPIAPYFNALLFRLFGSSVNTLKWFNALLIVALAQLIYRLVLTIADHVAATTCGIVFAIMFAGQQVSGAAISNATYNWLTPYSHDLTYGVALSIAMVAALWRASLGRRTLWLGVAGFLLGLIFLTKPEPFLAAAVAGFAGAFCLLRDPSLPRAKPIIVMIVSLLVPIVVATILVSPAHVIGGWRWVFDQQLLSTRFFKWVTGLEDPAGNTQLMFGWLTLYLFIVGPAVVLGWWAGQKGPSHSAIAAVAIALVIAVPALVFWDRIPWREVLRPLPVVVAIILGCVIWKLFREDPRESPRRALPISFGVLSLLLLAKTPLRVQPYYYGFALAMPANLYMLTAAVTCIPWKLNRRNKSGLVVRWAILSVVLVTLIAYVRMDAAAMAKRTHPIGEGANRFYADAEGAIVDRVAKDLIASTAPDVTLAAIPQGAMINFLSQRVNPTPYLSMMPPDMIMFGEDAMLESLQKNPPDYIALVHRDTILIGRRFFGQEYGARVMKWIVDNYDIPNGKLYGELPPFNEQNRFSILLVRHTGPGKPAPGLARN
jgi:hypothetical protein